MPDGSEEGGGRRKLRLGVLASGRGSNLQAIIDAGERGDLDAEVVVVISDRRNAEALRRAARHNIEGIYLDPKAFRSREEYDERLAALLGERRVDLVILAGYMRIVGPAVLRAFPWRVMNIHPALLPAFPGKEGQRQALEQGVKVSGCTVHFVDGGVDTGPIIIQRAVPVLEGDTVGDLADRILAEEHRIYPEAIQLYAEGRLRVVDGRRVEVLPRGAGKPGKEPAAGGPTPVPSSVSARRRRAVLSVYDKSGLIGFARGLIEAGFELVSSGGTARVLRDAGLPVIPVEDVTEFPEMLDGRVKTLHPAIHGGILARRDLPDHLAELARHGIAPVDLVCVNLYPFQATVNRLTTGRPGAETTVEALAEALENIDIGGPALIRAAAKNHEAVTVVTDPSQYEIVLGYLRNSGEVPLWVRRELALRAFRHTAFYDAVIASYLETVVADARPEGWEPNSASRTAPAAETEPPAPEAPTFPDHLSLPYEKVADLRYGENPHQAAAFYRHPLRRVLDDLGATLPGATLLQGKELSFNNIADAETALRCVQDLGDGPAAVAVKHGSPCGAAVGKDILEAYRRCAASDPVSIFGGIVALNRPVTAEAAAELAGLFLEIVLAPEFSPEALDLLGRKPDLRLLAVPVAAGRAVRAALDFEVRSVAGGLLVQTRDLFLARPEVWKPVTVRRPTPAELDDLWLAWRVCRYAKSNAVVLARSGQVVGIGGGQTNRVDAVRLAVQHAALHFREAGGAAGAVLASDGFFPFPDSVEAAAAAGVTAIAQPGGSLRDAESIRAADAAGLAMVFTGERHFRH